MEGWRLPRAWPETTGSGHARGKRPPWNGNLRTLNYEYNLLKFRIITIIKSSNIHKKLTIMYLEARIFGIYVKIKKLPTKIRVNLKK